MASAIEMVTTAVIEELQAQRYAHTSINSHKRCLSLFKDFCLERGGDYNSDIGADFIAQMETEQKGKYHKIAWLNPSRCVHFVDSYLQNGEVDFSKRRKQMNPLSSDEFDLLLKSWNNDMVDRGLAIGTIEQGNSYARKYLAFLESRKVYSLGDITASSIGAFVEELRATHSVSGIHSAVPPLRRFIVFTGRGDLLAALKIIKTEQERTIMPLLTEQDLNAIRSAAYSDEVIPRDRAMVLLALTTGLRACDIVALRLDDVDWRSCRISIIQQKTGNPLSLPLLPTVGNAISEYVLHSRPQSSDRRVFLSTKAPYIGLSGHASVYRVLRHVFDLAGVKAPYFGTRLTRHSAATRMLIAKVPSPTISAVLGHSDPTSTDCYITTDAEGMRSCVLPLPKAVFR
jgi:integrase